jgi:hypothetical protein
MTVSTSGFAEQMLIHIHLLGISGCISFSHSWHRWARFLCHHKLNILQPTDGMSLQSVWLWALFQSLWP